MIVIKIEIWPGGDPNLARPIGHGYIVNTGQGTPETGQYRAKFVSMSPSGPITREVRISRFRRLERDSVELIYEVLKKMCGGNWRKNV